MSEVGIAEEQELSETERCCALLEAVLKGLGASNCWAVDDRPNWEHEMAKPSRKEVSFSALLERVEGQFQLLSERVTGLDQKVERGLQDIRRDMETGFNDLQKGIKSLVSELQNHNHSGK